MKLTAYDSRTGRLLLRSEGGIDQTNFKKMIQEQFPDIPQLKLVLIGDGRVLSGDAPTQITALPTLKKSVVWKGSATDLGGYANMNREICFRLMHHGYAVKLEILPTGMQVDSSTMSLIRALESVKIPHERDCPMVVGFTPIPCSHKRRLIYFTMMETQSLHQEFVKRCNEDPSEVWVPCQFYKDVFRNSGVKTPIYVIPLGVNQNLYKPEATEPGLLYDDVLHDRRSVPIPQDKFRFMSLFGWSYRKGPDLLCKSFLREFKDSDNVALVIYSRYMGSSLEQHRDHVRKSIQGFALEAGNPTPPPIYYCGDEIPITQLPGCFAAADCFVFCSRGEGFGLPVVEAGACETPVISAYNTAMTEYLDSDVAKLVYQSGVEVADAKLTWISEFYRGQKFTTMGEKEIEAFQAHMRWVFDHPEESKSMAQRFRRKILERYTWDRAAANVALRLDAEG